ncbi:hypothetical protein HTG_17620 [Natrinema mahii]|nr:hypothetical protein HTG_17620 [Natrinema mahii]
MGRPSLSQIQRAKEKAELQGKWGMVDQLTRLEQQRHAELAPEPVEDNPVFDSSSDSPSDNSWMSQFPSSAAEHTSLALKKVAESDYKYRCKSCQVKPSVAGPHHDNSCSKNQGTLAISSELAHRRKCKHCSAQPYVAGAHHRRDCPRRLKKHIEKDASGRVGYSTECKHCGATPFSQGPHHEVGCKRKWNYTAYSTKLAHKYECKECGAKPFVAGPHHEGSCNRHFY